MRTIGILGTTLVTLTSFVGASEEVWKPLPTEAKEQISKEVWEKLHEGDYRYLICPCFQDDERTEKAMHHFMKAYVYYRVLKKEYPELLSEYIIPEFEKIDQLIVQE